MGYKFNLCWCYYLSSVLLWEQVHKDESYQFLWIVFVYILKQCYVECNLHLVIVYLNMLNGYGYCLSLLSSFLKRKPVPLFQKDYILHIYVYIYVYIYIYIYILIYIYICMYILMYVYMYKRRIYISLSKRNTTI